MPLNKVMLIGNVGADPEIRYLEGNNGAQGAVKVARFRLATTERYRDRNGESRESTEWHNIVAWRNSADLAEKFIRKGTQIYIEGKLRSRSWTDQNNVERTTVEVVADNIQLLGKRSDNPAAEGYQPQPRPAAQPAQRPAPQYAQPAQQPAPQPVQASPIDIMSDEGADDLPF